MTVEAMLYRMRVGCPWRDLPVEFGCWHSIYQQFNRWSSKNKFMKIFAVDWEHLDAADKPRHVGGGDEL